MHMIFTQNVFIAQVIIIVNYPIKLKPMKVINLVAIFILVSLSVSNSTDTMKCHYSCSSCTQPYHQYCKECIEGYTLRIVKNPPDIPVEFRTTRIPTGVCSGQKQLGSPNVLGIIILVSSFLLVPLTKSPLLFYIVSSLQSLSLLRFLEISWINPSNYILNSFQYLSPCNIITQDIKQNSWQIRLYSFFYINQMFVQPDLEKSLLFVGILDLVVFALIVFLHVFRTLKRKYCADQCREFVLVSEWALKNQIKFFNCLYFLLIQETVLSFVVALQFKEANAFTIATIIIYSIMTLLFCIYTYRVKMGLFPNRLLQYYGIVKKIVYPIFVVVPFEFQYFLIVLMGINCAMQAFFDYKIKSYPFKSLNTIYKFLQFVTILFAGIYYAVDRTASVAEPAFIMGIVFTVALCLNIVVFFIEVVRKIYENYQASLKEEQKRENKVAVPEASVIGRDQHNNTLGLVSTKRQQIRQSTESDLIQNQKIRQGNIKLAESIEEPPKIQRSDTKDSSFKNSKNERKDITIQQISQQKSQKMDTQQKGESEQISKIQKANQRRRMKTNQNLKSELKKRYGV